MQVGNVVDLVELVSTCSDGIDGTIDDGIEDGVEDGTDDCNP